MEEYKMNLYALKFRHYAPKDSKEGIITYLTAESSEAIYEWLKSEPVVNGDMIFNSYQYKEDDNETFNIYDDDYKVVSTETFKERMVRLNGEMFDEDADVSDAYYGVTHYGWELVNEGVYYTNILHTTNSLKISIVDIT
jgi:hypothetical protein